MQKPNNYEKVQAAGEFTPLELGGHILVIKQVEEMTSKTGKPMLKVSFDTADNDKQPHYFADKFRNDIRPDKKWPNDGTTYIVCHDADRNCSKSLKGFTTSAEKSNPGFVIPWNDTFGPSFKGKMIGGVFGIVHDAYNGKEVTKRQFRWFRSIDGINEVEIPADIETEEYRRLVFSAGTAPTDANGFMNIPDGIDEELPFN